MKLGRLKRQTSSTTNAMYNTPCREQMHCTNRHATFLYLVVGACAVKVCMLSLAGRRLLGPWRGSDTALAHLFEKTLSDTLVVNRSPNGA